jgi:transposase
MQKRSNTKRYDLSFKLSAVKLKLDKGYGYKLVARELGMTDTKSIREWVQRYEKNGEAGLVNKAPKMKPATIESRANAKELEELRTENAVLKYLLEAKKKDDLKRLKA